MSNSITINKILDEVKHLDHSERLYLMERLISLLKKDSRIVESAKKLKDLDGLGSEIWEGVNIDQYINDQRQWD